MYITINDVIGSKTIDLSYPIHSTAGWGKETAVVSMHISNSQILLHRYRSVTQNRQENCVE